MQLTARAGDARFANFFRFDRQASYSNLEPREHYARRTGLTFTCRFTTYRHRFARVAPAPRAKNRGRASPVKDLPNQVLTHGAYARCTLRTLRTRAIKGPGQGKV